MIKEVSIIGYPVREDDRSFLIELSERMAKASGQNELLLNAFDRLPHLTLSMMFLNHEQLHELLIEVQHIDTYFEVSCAAETQPYASSTAFAVQWLTVKSTPQLNSLHKEAMDLRKRFHAQIGLEKKCGWINVFDKHALNNYQPHFTIGYGPIVQCESRSVQLAVRVAALGERCTVQQILSA